MSEQTTTVPAGYHTTERHYGQLREVTAGSLGADWTLTLFFRSSSGSDFRASGVDWVRLGSAHTSAVRINGVTYSGTIIFGYRISTGERAWSLGNTYYDWTRYAADGTKRDGGLTEAARPKLAAVAEELAAHYPNPTIGDVRDLVAETAHSAAGAALESLQRDVDRFAERLNGGVADGFARTVAEAFAAAFRNALGSEHSIITGTGWASVGSIAALGTHNAGYLTPETPWRAEQEAAAFAAAEEQRWDHYRNRSRS